MKHIIEIIVLFATIYLIYVTNAEIPSDNLGKNKVVLQNLDESNRLLRPSLNIRSGPEDVLEVMAGQSMSLECEAGGTPPPNFHWLKDGKKVHQNVHEGLYASSSSGLESHLGLGFTRSRLFVDCVMPSDAGTYTCVAENEYIRQYKASQVFVSDTFGAESKDLCLVKKSFGSPAKVYMWTHSRLELMDMDVQLYCRATGDPYPSVLWKGPDDAIIANSNKFQLLPNGDLVIRNLKWSDMGGYTCHVKNAAGSDDVSVFLYPSMPDKMRKK